MKRWMTAILALTFALTLAAPAMAAEMTPREILDHVDDMFRGQSSQGALSMHIVTEHWERTLKVEWWSQGKEKSLLRILAPKKEEGTATLRVDNDIWNYLPKTDKTIKLPSSMMSGSWMGSHFTNDDLVKETRLADDYTFEKTFEGERDGRKVIEITCIPKPEAPVVWGKQVITVRAEDYLPIVTRYYDEDMNLARTMSFTNIGPLGDRTLPRTMIIQPEDKPNEKTEVVYEEMTFDLDLGEDVFTLRNLRR